MISGSTDAGSWPGGKNLGGERNALLPELHRHADRADRGPSTASNGACRC
jgi:hypothetical protein